MPERLLDVELDFGNRCVIPRYLTTRDHLWVEHLLGELEALCGKRRSEVQQRLRWPPRRGERPAAWRAMCELLLRRQGFAVQAARPPVEVRAAVFAAGAGAAPITPTNRQQVLASAGAALSIDATAVDEALYADIPAERRLKPGAAQLSAPEAIERYNLALAQGLLLRAQQLRVQLEGQVKGVLRFARLQRLLCHAERAGSVGATLTISGPLSLFRFTTKYGRAMAAWLPVLGRATRWRLTADCVLRDELLRWEATFRDPIGTTHAPLRPFDSALERRLFRDLRRVAPWWQVFREAEAVQIGSRIVSPDFTLQHERTGQRVSVEVVGFWTPEYLADKLELIAKLPPDQRWIVCIDEQLAARAAELPAGPSKLSSRDSAHCAEFFLFRRRIDAEALVSFIEKVAS